MLPFRRQMRRRTGPPTACLGTKPMLGTFQWVLESHLNPNTAIKLLLSCPPQPQGQKFTAHVIWQGQGREVVNHLLFSLIFPSFFLFYPVYFPPYSFFSFPSSPFLSNLLSYPPIQPPVRMLTVPALDFCKPKHGLCFLGAHSPVKKK